MNLRGLANSVTQALNPNVNVVFARNNGEERRRGGVRVPSYLYLAATIQLQALDADDLRQLDGLNISGVRRAVYLNGALSGVIRVDQKGGDFIVFDPTLPGSPYEGPTWLCVHVLEQWPDWCKVAISLQNQTIPIAAVQPSIAPNYDFSKSTNSQNLPG